MRPRIPLFFALFLILLATPLLAEPPSAATGTNTLAVAWRTSTGNVLAAVIASNGDLLGRFSLGSATAAPALAFDGVRYLAVWPNGTLNGRFFDENGNLSDTLPPHGDAADVPPAISWNGADFVIVFLNSSRGGYVVESRNAQGMLENANLIAAGVSPLFFTPSVAVASSGTTTLVALAYSSSSTMLGYVTAIAVDSTLHAIGETQLDSGPITLYGAAGGGYVPQTPDVAASPAGFLVTWLSSNGRPVPTTLRAARVGLDGAAIDTTPLTIATSPTSETDSTPRVTWDGTKFFEIWTRSSGGPDAGTWASVITTSGQVSAPGQLLGDTRPADVTGITPGRDAVFWTSDTQLLTGLVGVASERRRAAGH